MSGAGDHYRGRDFQSGGDHKKDREELPSEMKASESEWLGVPKHRASGIRLCGCGFTVFDLADGKSVLRAALLDRRECELKATTQGLLGGSVRNTVRQVMN